MIHTPGPWLTKWNGAHGRLVIGLTSAAPVVAVVSGIAPGISTEDGKGNAQLIAAAPDLLEALKAWEQLFLSDFAISLSTRRPMTNGDQEEIDAVLIKARAAIAKAEGK